MPEHVDSATFEASLEPGALDNVPPAYRAFRDGEGIPVHTGLIVENLDALETGPWDRTGQRGAFVNLYGAGGVDDLQVHDLAPGGETTLQNHLHEEIVYVSRGRGLTSLGVDGDTVFEWHEHSAFLLPPNTPYRHVNTSDTSEARLVSQTPLPELFNLVRDEAIIFPPPGRLESSVDRDAYSGDGILSQEADGVLDWNANFVPDLLTFDELQTWDTFGSLRIVRLFLESGMGRDAGAHIGEIPARTYRNAHRHGPGATVFILSGSGYSLLWREEWVESIEIEWSPGAAFSPPARWYHQHFNLEATPARTYAPHVPKYGTITRSSIFAGDHPDNVIDYVDESPDIREEYEARIERRGLESAMPPECYEDPSFSFADT